MDGVEGPSRSPKPLLSFNSREDINDLAVGCDADIGGMSSARLDFVPDSPDDPSGKGKGKFWGDMKLGLRENNAQGSMRSGYAGFRSKVCMLAERYILVCVSLADSSDFPLPLSPRLEIMPYVRSPVPPCSES